MQGGGDRSELRPLRPDGNVDHDMAGHHVVGNHKGQFSAYNVVDPRPGTVHQFGNRADVLGARQRGWWVAREGDGTPAYRLSELYHSDPATPLDTSDAFCAMVHLVTSEENYRRLMEEQQAANRAQLEPAGLDFLERASASEFMTGRGGRSMATRFATADHGTFVTQGDTILEHLTPRGVQREEDL